MESIGGGKVLVRGRGETLLLFLVSSQVGGVAYSGVAEVGVKREVGENSEELKLRYYKG